MLHMLSRAEVGITVLPPAFSQIVDCALRPPNRDVLSWLTDILISSYRRGMLHEISSSVPIGQLCGV